MRPGLELPIGVQLMRRPYEEDEVLRDIAVGGRSGSCHLSAIARQRVLVFLFYF